MKGLSNVKTSSLSFQNALKKNSRPNQSNSLGGPITINKMRQYVKNAKLTTDQEKKISNGINDFNKQLRMKPLMPYVEKDKQLRNKFNNVKRQVTYAQKHNLLSTPPSTRNRNFSKQFKVNNTNWSNFESNLPAPRVMLTEQQKNQKRKNIGIKKAQLQTRINKLITNKKNLNTALVNNEERQQLRNQYNSELRNKKIQLIKLESELSSL